MASSSPQILEGKLTVVSTWLCPFAQRTLLALKLKGVNCVHSELSEHDLYNKPAWFLDLNPAGLVPTVAWLEGGERRVLSESLIINEYIDEALPGPPLLPAGDHFARAKARLAIDRFSCKAVPEFYKLLLRQDKAEQDAAARALDQQLLWLAKEGVHPEGPFALGGAPSLVDCAILPFILRLPILKHYRGYEPPAAAAGRLSAYVAAALALPEVAATRVHPAGQDYDGALITAYQRYADGSAKSQVARELSNSKGKEKEKDDKVAAAQTANGGGGSH